MTQMAFMASAHHTGTHFVRAMLTQDLNEWTSYFGSIGTLEAGDCTITDPDKTTHVSSYYRLLAAMYTIANDCGKDKVVFHSHFGGFAESLLSYSYVGDLMGKFPTVVPVRDPLLAVLTAFARFPNVDHVKILYAFHFMAEAVSSTGAFFVPVDLLAAAPFEERRRIVGRMYRYLRWNVGDAAIDRWAEWPRIASTIGTTTDDRRNRALIVRWLYKCKDVRSIERLVPLEFATLRAMEPKIRPFLERLGYEDLLWWS